MGKASNSKHVESVKNNVTLKEYKGWPYIIFFCAFLVYFNTIKFNYALDDKSIIYGNTVVQKGIAGIPEILSKGSMYGWDKSNVGQYRPFFLLTFAVEKSIFGKHPASGHFINILLYGILCIVLFKFLKRILSNYPVYIAAFITLLFVLHPIHTEVVANIKSRDEILCMLFGFLSLNAFLSYADTNKPKYLVYSVLTFFLCIHSKETGFAYLIIYPLLLYFFTNSTFVQIFKRTLPYIAIAAIGIFIRIMVLDSLMFGEHLDVYANSLEGAKSISELFATRFFILLHALKLLILPYNLSWDYSFNQFPLVGWGNIAVIVSLLIHLGMLFFAFYGLKKKKLYSFIILFYIFTYLMSSNLLFNIVSTFGERFLFAPSLAFCMMFPFLLAFIFKMDVHTMIVRKLNAFTICLGIVLLLYSFKTNRRNLVWSNDATLFASGVETSPQSVRTHYTYANYLFFVSDAGKSKDASVTRQAAVKALDEYTKANEIDPKVPEQYYEMGLVYSAIGEDDHAIDMYKKSLTLNPNLSQALNNYGLILYNKADYQGALELFLRGTKSSEQNPRVFAGAASCYMMLNNQKLAIDYFQKALAGDPKDEYSAFYLKKLLDATSAVPAKN